MLVTKTCLDTHSFLRSFDVELHYAHQRCEVSDQLTIRLHAFYFGICHVKCRISLPGMMDIKRAPERSNKASMFFLANVI